MQLLALGLTFALYQEPELVPYADKDLNLGFSHPASWKIEKRDKRRTVLRIPADTADRSGQLELIRANFRGDTEAWQSLQRTSNELQKRVVNRQWEQQVLGVPLLLTQLEYSEKGVAYTQVSGLFYSRTSQKLLFHLRAPGTSFENVWFQWQKVMETFKTINGDPLPVEDPTAPPPTKKQVQVRPARTVLDDGATKPSSVNAKPLASMSVSERTVNILAASGWELENVNGAKAEFFFKKQNLRVVVELNFLADSLEPSRALMAKASDRLPLFKSVSYREDVEAEGTPAGGTVGSVLRVGLNQEDQRIAAFDAYLKSSDFYVLLAAESSDLNKWKGQQREIKRLLSSLKLSTNP
jgi:hypothetical protein